MSDDERAVCPECGTPIISLVVRGPTVAERYAQPCGHRLPPGVAREDGDAEDEEGEDSVDVWRERLGDLVGNGGGCLETAQAAATERSTSRRDLMTGTLSTAAGLGVLGSLEGSLTVDSTDESIVGVTEDGDVVSLGDITSWGVEPSEMELTADGELLRQKRIIMANDTADQQTGPTLAELEDRIDDMEELVEMVGDMADTAFKEIPSDGIEEQTARNAQRLNLIQPALWAVVRALERIDLLHESERSDVPDEIGEDTETGSSEGRCTCGDYEHRKPAGGCKHIRRVKLGLGLIPVPAGVELDRCLVDTREKYRVDVDVEVYTSVRDAHTPDSSGQEALADGGQLIHAIHQSRGRIYDGVCPHYSGG